VPGIFCRRFLSIPQDVTWVPAIDMVGTRAGLVAQALFFVLPPLKWDLLCLEHSSVPLTEHENQIPECLSFSSTGATRGQWPWLCTSVPSTVPGM
jgi:hypothetical protein